MLSGENPSAKKMVDLRVGVSARDVYALAAFVILVPKHGYAMRRVLAAQSNNFRHSLRANVFKANQADAGNCKTLMEFGPEARWELALHHLRLNAKVSENSSPDYSLNRRQLHY